MNTMTLSQMQRDHVTKNEFGDFEAKTEESFYKIEKRFDAVDERFDLVDKRFVAVDKRFDAVYDSIRDLKAFTMEGFQKMEEYIDNSFSALGNKMDIRFDELGANIKDLHALIAKK